MHGAAFASVCMGLGMRWPDFAGGKRGLTAFTTGSMLLVFVSGLKALRYLSWHRYHDVFLPSRAMYFAVRSNVWRPGTGSEGEADTALDNATLRGALCFVNYAGYHGYSSDSGPRWCTPLGSSSLLGLQEQTYGCCAKPWEISGHRFNQLIPCSSSASIRCVARLFAEKCSFRPSARPTVPGRARQPYVPCI